MDNKCGWCDENATLSCGNCHQAFYCGRDHQRNHWSKHKNNCKSYQINETSTQGRHLVASRNLPAGTLIMQEKAFVLGPQATSHLVCLGCHDPIMKNDFDKCPQCFWPLCSTSCPSIANHDSECQILKRDVKQSAVPHHQGETPRYDLILLVRSLLLREENPSSWQKILNMEGHVITRKQDAEPHHVAAVRFASEVFKMDFEIDALHHTRGAIITNSINTRSMNGLSFRGLYATISLLNHSCLPNVTLRSDKSHNVFIRTAVNVKKGDPLVFSYVPTTDPLWKRQDELKSIYHFSCQCLRCLDPKGLGLHYSSPKCSNCFNIIDASLDSEWVCPKCENKIPLKDIIKASNELMEWISLKKLDIKHLHLFLKNVAEKYHSSHFLYVEALQKTLKFVSDQDTIKCLEVRRRILEEILQIQDVIEPGKTRKRGITLVNLAKIRLEFIGHHATNNRMGGLSSPEVREEYEKIYINLIKKAKSILDLEPPNSTEQIWVSDAKELEAMMLITMKNW